MTSQVMKLRPAEVSGQQLCGYLFISLKHDMPRRSLQKIENIKKQKYKNGKI